MRRCKDSLKQAGRHALCGDDRGFPQSAPWLGLDSCQLQQRFPLHTGSGCFSSPGSSEKTSYASFAASSVVLYPDNLGGPISVTKDGKHCKGGLQRLVLELLLCSPLLGQVMAAGAGGLALVSHWAQQGPPFGQSPTAPHVAPHLRSLANSRFTTSYMMSCS